ncbi:hypothetical protein CsSME_00012567 [Camellia sinensis var. sinensis]
MEEEETQELGEISGKDLNNHEEGNRVDEKLGTYHTEDTNSSDDNKDGIESKVVLQGVDSVTIVPDDDHFEQVSLKDQGGHGDLSQSQSSDNLRHSSGGSEEADEYSAGKFNSEFGSPPATGVHHDRHSSSPGAERQPASNIRQSSSSASLESGLYFYRDSGHSPVGSPQKPRPKPAMPNVSPELLHLVDSAIMGKPESLDKLKNVVSGIVSFGNGEEAESIAFLVVDSLLATMGGVESFEEDEDNNPPSVMLNSRAAIVAGELIPWLPWQGDMEDHMSPRTRMVRGLLAILRACTRNRAMCSTAGLLGVLLMSAEKIFVEDVGSTEQLKWDEEQEGIDNLEGRENEVEKHGDIETRMSGMAEQPLRPSVESQDPPAPSRHDLVENPSAVAPGYVPSELDETIVLELPSSMVRPLRVLRGTFQITTRRINFIVDNTESSSGDGLDHSSESRVQEKDHSWLMSSLHQIYSRRYLLRRSSLELFMVDRSNYFFDFGSTEGRRNAYRAIVHARPPHLNNIYLATQRPDQLLKRTQLMERWARWEISNFEYLMQLNTLAGRSYNDITQYPVFPWILSDYCSRSLDLENPSSYRDLSKPIGALNADRLKKFQERYSSFDDPVIPKFHYGSHYSSAGTVLYYLVRVEPFTTLSIQLQGGKFDHADRMFLDIGATWNGVIEDMSDVKELVPELFYLSEMLTNENSIDFGTTQLGEKLDSVILPPWAENPVDFVHKHRKALESEHVSAHLHEWIDLVFGYKQRGKEAIAANNMFFYITYEGTVDIDKISDPVQQRATQDQIAYFGQTPSQLLTVPHLKRMPLADVLHLQTIFRNPKEVQPYVVPSSERCNLPAAAIHASQDSVIIVDMNAPAAHVAQHKWQPNTPDGHGLPFLFQHGKASAGSAGGAFMRMFKGPPTGSGSEEWHFPQALAFAASGIRSSAVVAITSDKEIITGGHVDNCVRVISSDGARTLETARGHCAPVTCLALSPDSNYLVTGSRDATVLIWRIHRASTSLSRTTSEPSMGSGTPTSTSSNTLANILADRSRRRRIEGPIHVLRGHLGEIICCCVSSDLGIVVSCSNSSDVLLHSIRRGRLIRQLVGVEAHAVCLSSDGVIMAWNKLLNTLSTFTLNGTLITKARLPFSCSISCMEISVDGQSALIGLNLCSENDRTSDNSKHLKSEKSGIGDDNVESYETNEDNRLEIHPPSICFFDMHSLKVFHTLKLSEGQDVTALALNKDNTNLLVSTADKQLTIFTDPELSLKVVDHMLKLGWEGDGLSPLIK